MKLYGGLLQHEAKIAVRLDREIVVSNPAKLHGLPLKGLNDHMIDFLEDPHRGRRP